MIVLNKNQKTLIDIIENFSEKEIEQVITFAEFLVYQKNKEIEEISNKVISENIKALKELAKYD